MPNARFSKELSQLGLKQLGLYSQSNKKMGENLRVAQAAIVDPKLWKKDKDIPFGPGDRVQITRGPHKGKICQIMFRYDIGNAFYVNGIFKETKAVNPIEVKGEDEDNYEPVTSAPMIFDYNDFRLVSKIRDEDGKSIDVAVHSVSLGPEMYDPVSNTHKRVRYATHDESMVIPWPTEPAKRTEADKAVLTTAPEIADLRTHFVTSAVDAPMPFAAIPQITNLNNRFRRSRYSKRITEKDVAKYSPPVMPSNPKTRKMLEEIANMAKPEETPFTNDIRDFIGAEIKRGLVEKKSKEIEALEQYK